MLRIRSLQLLSLLAALLLFFPLLGLVLNVFDLRLDDLVHLFLYVLPHALWTTVLLVTCVGGLSLVLGVCLGAGYVFLDLPYKRVLFLFLLAPLVMPAYISAFSYAALTESQGFLREILLYFKFLPELRSFSGGLFILTLSLYPYVFLTAVSVFQIQKHRDMIQARALGAPPLRAFFRVYFPAGFAFFLLSGVLVGMETLNDLGVAEFLGLSTLPRVLISSWFGVGGLPAACFVGLIILMLALALLSCETFISARCSPTQMPHLMRNSYIYSLRWPLRALTVFMMSLPPVFGFVLPFLYLLRSAMLRFDTFDGYQLFHAAFHSLTLVVLSGLLALILAIFIFVKQHLMTLDRLSYLSRFGLLGYAVPGVLIAVGSFVVLGNIEAHLASFFAFFGFNIGLIFTSTGLALVVGLGARFVSVGFTPLRSAAPCVPARLGDAARVLGAKDPRLLWRVYLPALLPVFALGFLAVSIDVLKELPITLLLKPFQFETLATLVYRSAEMEYFENGVWPALSLILLCFVFGLFYLFAQHTAQRMIHQ